MNLFFLFAKMSKEQQTRVPAMYEMLTVICASDSGESKERAWNKKFETDKTQQYL